MVGVTCFAMMLQFPIINCRPASFVGSFWQKSRTHIPLSSSKHCKVSRGFCCQATANTEQDAHAEPPLNAGSLRKLSRRELQSVAKLAGVKANRKSAEIITELLSRPHRRSEQGAPEELAPEAAPLSTATSEQDAHVGSPLDADSPRKLSRRELQRVAKLAGLKSNDIVVLLSQSDPLSALHENFAPQENLPRNSRLRGPPSLVQGILHKLTRLALLCHAEEQGYMDVLELRWDSAVVTPVELAVAAYFPLVMEAALKDWKLYGEAVNNLIRILEAPETFPGRQHLIRYRGFWNNEAVAFALDELQPSQSTEWPEGAAAMPPRRLLNVLREAAEERALGVNPPYHNLKELPDGPVGEDGLQIQILRSHHRVVEVQAELSYCAEPHMTTRLQSGDLVLVALVDTSRTLRYLHGHPVALAGWETEKAFFSHLHRKGATDKDVLHFDLFFPFLQAWSAFRRVCARL